jgi:hypothetical protein
VRSQEWTVPVGGGIGKIFEIGSQAMNAPFNLSSCRFRMMLLVVEIVA